MLNHENARRFFLPLIVPMLAVAGCLTAASNATANESAAALHPEVRALAEAPEVVEWFRVLCLPLPQATAEDFTPIADPTTRRAARPGDEAPCVEQVIYSLHRCGVRHWQDIFEATPPDGLANAPVPTLAPPAIVVSAPIFDQSVIAIEIHVDQAPRAAN